jgi:hypothetical protein
MKTIAICLLPLFAVGVFAQGPQGGGFGPMGVGARGMGMPGARLASRTPVAGEPYSATETVTSQQTLANGNQISRTHTMTVARDSQGRTSTSETVTPPAASGKAPFTIERILDPVAGYRYELNSSTMIAMQEASRTPPASTTTTPPARPTPPNQTTTSLGTQTINGVSATGTQVTETIAAGAIGNSQAIQIVRTSWVSTALQVPVEIKTSDPRFGTSDMELTGIVQAEPNASLFVVPAGYTIKQGGGRGPGGRGPGAGPAQWRGRGTPPQE